MQQTRRAHITRRGKYAARDKARRLSLHNQIRPSSREHSTNFRHRQRKSLSIASPDINSALAVFPAVVHALHDACIHFACIHRMIRRLAPVCVQRKFRREFCPL